jgi:2-oxoglutarate ferredoxin oxidoreductase subunit gamma
MEKKLIIAGFGGQGIIMAGTMLAHSGMLEKKKVTLVPSYGPEIRGGTANCTVILKDSEIYSQVVTHPDILIAMNQPSMDKFECQVAMGGMIIYNASLCSPAKRRKDVQYHGIHATEMAGKLGDIRVANTVILGALIGQTHLVKSRTFIDKTLPELLTGKKASLIELNRKALLAGMNGEG